MSDRTEATRTSNPGARTTTTTSEVAAIADSELWKVDAEELTAEALHVRLITGLESRGERQQGGLDCALGVGDGPQRFRTAKRRAAGFAEVSLKCQPRGGVLRVAPYRAILEGRPTVTSDVCP